ncbi:response regulator, partial [bacterium]|nr:response regulator [bacterium]
MTLKSQPEKTKGSSILWIDDDHDIFRYTLPIFKKKGFSIVECLSGEEGIKELDENNQQYSLILLDLDMPGIDGIITFERIISINPRIPIVIVSAYSNQPTWRQRLELFRKIGITIEQVGKPFPPVGTEEFEEIIALFKRLQSEYLGKKTLDPFNYTFDEFRKLSHEERNHCTSIASKLNYTLVNDYLEDNPDVDWIVIAKYPGNVIKSGKTEDEPFDEDLEKWAEELDGPVFTYSRPETIFKLDTGTPSGITNTGWHMRNDSKGFFPTVCLKFESEFAGKFDFDTGSVNSYLLLENAKI